MYDDKIIRGYGTDRRRPVWAPLRKLLPPKPCGPFMWMCQIRLADDTLLQAYKHSDTRQYLLVDAEGNTWEHLDHYGYRRMRRSEAISFVLGSWWVLKHATDAERAALARVLEDAAEHGDDDEAADAHILPSSPSCGFRRLPMMDLDTWEPIYHGFARGAESRG